MLILLLNDLAQPGHIIMHFSLDGRIDPDLKITQDIHVVDESIIGSIVRIEIGMYLTIGEKLCGHVVEMVTYLQKRIVLFNRIVIGRVDLFAQGI